MLRPACHTGAHGRHARSHDSRPPRTGCAATRPAVEAGAPWPLADAFDDSDEARWGPREVLAHLAEMAAVLARARSNGSWPASRSPVPFGRIATDPVRIGLIERDRSLPPRELYDRIDDALERLDAPLARADRRPSWPGAASIRRAGEMTVGAMPDRFIVGHLADHVVQLETILGGASPAPA